MRHILKILLLCILGAAPAIALETIGEVTNEPICFTLRNEAPYRVYGEVSTDYVTLPDGLKTRHTGTFRLEKAGATHKDKGYPLDVTEFCSSGPFYPNRQLEITLRTLFPTFSCKTSIELGEIVIKGMHKAKGGTKSWVECY